VRRWLIVGLRDSPLLHLFLHPFLAVEVSEAVDVTAGLAETPLTMRLLETAIGFREVLEESQDSRGRDGDATLSELAVCVRDTTRSTAAVPRHVEGRKEENANT
jgi:hypothetical protein